MTEIVLALDIDGVLNSGADNARLHELVVEQGFSYREIHEDASLPYRFIDQGNFVNTDTVALLKGWVERHQANVVGVSSWFSYRQDADSVSRFLGIEIADVIEYTGGGTHRARSLSDWVAVHLPTRLVVLDDQWDGYREYGFEPHHVCPVVGLTDGLVKQMDEIAYRPVNHTTMATLKRVQELRRRARDRKTTEA